MINKKHAAKAEKICQKATSAKRNCIYSGCCNQTINSHFAPKGKWLDVLGGNHFYRLEREQFYNIPTTFFKFEERGRTQVMSVQLFCEKHDDELFSIIEKSEEVDYTNTVTQKLMIYRTLCALVRQSEINQDMFNELNIEDGIDVEQKIQSKFNTLISKLQDTNCTNFQFELFEHDYIEVCVSNIWEFEGYNSGLIVNLFPYESNGIKKTYILICYETSEYGNLKSFIDLLKDKLNFLENLTFFMISFPENWIMSKALYNSLEQKENKLQTFLKYIVVDKETYRDKSIRFNLFA